MVPIAGGSASREFKGIKGDPVGIDAVLVSASGFGKIAVVFAAGGPGDVFGFAGVNFKGFSYKDNDGSLKFKVLTAPEAVPINAPNTRLVLNVLG